MHFAQEAGRGAGGGIKYKIYMLLLDLLRIKTCVVVQLKVKTSKMTL